MSLLRVTPWAQLAVRSHFYARAKRLDTNVAPPTAAQSQAPRDDAWNVRAEVVSSEPTRNVSSGRVERPQYIDTHGESQPTAATSALRSAPESPPIAARYEDLQSADSPPTAASALGADLQRAAAAYSEQSSYRDRARSIPGQYLDLRA